MPGEPGRIGQQRAETLHSPVDRDVIDLDAALGQQLLHIPVWTGRTADTSAPLVRSPPAGTGTR
jgi:hypothetical protein